MQGKIARLHENVDVKALPPDHDRRAADAIAAVALEDPLTFLKTCISLGGETRDKALALLQEALAGEFEAIFAQYDKRRQARRRREWHRDWQPYCLVKRDDGTWTMVGREYKKVGDRQSTSEPWCDWNAPDHVIWRFKCGDPFLLKEGIWRMPPGFWGADRLYLPWNEHGYGCTTNPATGLTSPTTGIVSMYRRPLPSTNLGFLTTIMWDGRESSLTQQGIDATLIHAQATAAPTADQQKQIVDFETGIFTAQIFDDEAGSLRARNATGGPIALSLQLSKFFVGVNDPVGLNPTGLPFDPNIFDLYKPWLGLRSDGDEAQYRLSVARGEEVFNTTKINITGVAGLNDVLNLPSIAGFCGICHDTPNVGNHSVKAPLNIGIADAGANSPPALDISGLPVFTLQCNRGPLAGQTFAVTDPGRALISGKCADIGKVKGPILRGLAARAPYFHNGSAATLADAVNFYDQRFGIGFTERQKNDLVNFLNTL